MEGYDSIFQAAVQNYEKDKDKYDFSNFRSCLNIFQFIVNNNPNPDGEALTLAYKINVHLFAKYFTIPKPYIGYASNPEYYSQCDNLDSRHIMMATIIVDVLQKTDNIKHIKHVVEIGGGFGNWARLLTAGADIQYDKWTIIDLPHISHLQQWYLKQTLSWSEFKKIEFVTTNDYEKWLDHTQSVDLIIGSHSLSEISYKNFQKYIPLMKISKFLFYGYHKDLPHPFLIHDKKIEIEKEYDPIATFKSETGKVFNVVYKHK